MSLTSELKNELAMHKCETISQWQSEISTMLRFVNSLHVIAGHVVIEAELDSSKVTARLIHALKGLYKIDSSVNLVKNDVNPENNKYVVRIVKNADKLARKMGLIESSNRMVRLIKNRNVSDIGLARAIVRGAFLISGSLTVPCRGSAFEIICPGIDSGNILADAINFLGIPVKARDMRGVTKITIRDQDEINKILEALGAVDTLRLWDEERKLRQMRGNINRLANFDDANLRRSVRAAVATSTKVRRAFEILGDDVPEQLKQAGLLRLEHKESSLEELGRFSTPPVSKDTVAGRLRRLINMADKRAKKEGIPTTLDFLKQVSDEQSL